ncbi:MAG: hypothetical protein ABSG75_14580 [Syntrophales bacterium]
MEEKIYYDVSLVAFLALFVNEDPKTITLPAGRVGFKFRADLKNALANYHADAPVPIASYIKKVREVRSLIFAMREGGNGS